MLLKDNKTMASISGTIYSQSICYQYFNMHLAFEKASRTSAIDENLLRSLLLIPKSTCEGVNFYHPTITHECVNY